MLPPPSSRGVPPPAYLAPLLRVAGGREQAQGGGHQCRPRVALPRDQPQGWRVNARLEPAHPQGWRVTPMLPIYPDTDIDQAVIIRYRSLRCQNSQPLVSVGWLARGAAPGTQLGRGGLRRPAGSHGGRRVEGGGGLNHQSTCATAAAAPVGRWPGELLLHATASAARRECLSRMYTRGRFIHDICATQLPAPRRTPKP